MNAVGRRAVAAVLGAAFLQHSCSVKPQPDMQQQIAMLLQHVKRQQTEAAAAVAADRKGLKR